MDKIDLREFFKPSKDKIFSFILIYGFFVYKAINSNIHRGPSVLLIIFVFIFTAIVAYILTSATIWYINTIKTEKYAKNKKR